MQERAEFPYDTPPVSLAEWRRFACEQRGPFEVLTSAPGVQMMIYRFGYILFLLFMLSQLASCAMPPHFNVIESGQPLPPGQTILIAKFQLNPFLEQGDLPVYAGKAARKRGEMFVMIYPDRDTPYKQGAMIPLPLAAAISANVNFLTTSFLPLPPGDRYIRYGTLDQSVKGFFDGRKHTTTMYTLDLVGDVGLEIPSSTKAVYAGTITWHYQTGEITVKDEFEAAMKDLDKAHISGLTRADVAKRIARVYPPNLK
jgi:hypothetical protein